MIRAILWRLAVVVVVLGIMVALGLWKLATSQPTWYSPPDPERPEVVELADRVEYNLVQQAQQIRPPKDDVWSLRIREHQVNAWLSARLPAWIANRPELRWPEELGTPQVQLEQDAVRIAVSLHDEDGDAHVISARLLPVWLDEAEVAATIESVALGRITIPGDPLSSLLRLAEGAGLMKRVNPAKLDEARAYLAGSRGAAPIVQLADGRYVELLHFALHPGAVDITCRTLAESARTTNVPRLPRIDGP